MSEPLITKETATFPFTPFLLTTLTKDGGRRHFVIENMEGLILEVQGDRHLMQSFVWTAHKASEEEIKKFLEDNNE